MGLDQMTRDCSRKASIVQDQRDIGDKRAPLGQFENSVQQKRCDGLGRDPARLRLNKCGLNDRADHIQPDLVGHWNRIGHQLPTRQA